MPPIRLHTSSTGIDPAALRPGRDLVLRLHPLHGADAPEGTYALDALDPAARRAADAAALDALADWTARLDGRLTSEGISWPFVWQLPLYRLLNGAVARAVALRAALAAHGASAIELADTGEDTARLAACVAADLGIAVRTAPGARAPAPLEPSRPAPSRLTRARRSVVDGIAALGAPSVLRSGSVAIHAYWPLMPLLDRMLAEGGHRPALFLGKRPSGVGRSLRTARAGGVIGSPTPADRRWARPRAARLVETVRAEPSVQAAGMELGPWLHPQIAAMVSGRAAGDLANRRFYRRAFRRGVRWVVGAYDVDPDARLMVLCAKEAGVRTLMLCHGCYVLPQPFADLDVCDEVALWSYDTAPDITDWNRPVHVVGYPLPHDPPPPTRPRPAGRPPRIGVMGHGTIPTSSVLDDRITMASYVTALEAIARRFPDAEVVLRPNLREDDGPFRALSERFPGLRLTRRTGGDILGVHREVDLMIGAASTASFQTALVGTPLILLNLTGTEWPFPLGGEATSVAVARSATELDGWLAAWERDRVLPGRDDLLQGLGAGDGRAVDRLLGVLEGRAVPDGPPPVARRPRALTDA